MYHDNQSVIYIANTLVYHERMRVIDVNYPFIIELFVKGRIIIIILGLRGGIITPYIKSKDQILDLFTINSLGHIEYLCAPNEALKICKLQLERSVKIIKDFLPILSLLFMVLGDFDFVL